MKAHSAPPSSRSPRAALAGSRAQPGQQPCTSQHRAVARPRPEDADAARAAHTASSHPMDPQSGSGFGHSDPTGLSWAALQESHPSSWALLLATLPWYRSLSK